MVYWIVSVLFDWPKQLLWIWFYDTHLKPALSKALSFLMVITITIAIIILKIIIRIMMMIIIIIIIITIIIIIIITIIIIIIIARSCNWQVKTAARVLVKRKMEVILN